MYKNVDLARKDILKILLMIHGENGRKKTEKGHVRKEPGVTTQGRRERWK